MMKIGIMGGTFNPIHNVHLLMAEEAARQFKLDEVWFMPSKNPPHKKGADIVSAAHRTRMICHAIEGNPKFVFSDLELRREGTTYTSDTLEIIEKENPDCEIYFILGGDSLREIETWHKPAFVMSHCHILAADREDETGKQLKEKAEELRKTYKAKISFIKMPLIDISSSKLRRQLQKGKSVDYRIPDAVMKYIRFHSLYGYEKPLFKKKVTTPKILSYLKATLRPKRFRHTLGVAYTAANLAAVHNADEDKAFLAGLLHDCAKFYETEEQITLCEKAGIPLTETERLNPALIHGKLGAFYAKTKYQVDDEEILSAIRYHTTGHPDMTALEKIIYLADYIEPGRSMDCKPHSLQKVRTACFQNLDEGMRFALENGISYLREQNQPIDTISLETYEWYQKGITL